MGTTLIDVARAAGVSRSTASRSLAGHPAVLPETRLRVAAAAERLGYRVNPMARALRVGRSHLLGLVVTNLTNASVQAIAAQVQAQARASGNLVLIGVTDGDAEVEREVIESLIDRQVDGLLVMSSGGNTDYLNKLPSIGADVVTMIRYPAGTCTSTVLDDDFDGAITITRHLLDLGHRDIAYIGASVTIRSGAERLRGFREACAAHQVEPDNGRILLGASSPDFGRSAIDDLLDSPSPPTALMVASHEAMFGVLPRLAERGVAIPASMSIAGFEDAPLFRYWSPGITVLDTNPVELGQLALDLLLSKIAGRAGRAQSEPSEGTVDTVASQLIIRDSCAPLT